MFAAFKSVMKWLVYAGLVAVAIGLMVVGKVDIVLVQRLSLRINDAAIPALEVLSRPVDAAIAGLARIRSWTDLVEENARLREDRERLLRWQAVAQRLEVENIELRRLINVVPEPETSFVSARVVADSVGVFAHSLLLNAGSFAGVERNQVVLSGEGLAGRIIGVSERASRVLLITDINSRIPVSVGPSRVRAVLAGDNTDRPRLVHVVAGEPIRVGDPVVTSGIAGVLPCGLPIGTVEMVDEDRLAVRTHVDPSRLEYVRVVDYGIEQIRVDPPVRALRHAAVKRLSGQPDMHAAAQ
jgi:rod shape-determining protein MreC